MSPAVNENIIRLFPGTKQGTYQGDEKDIKERHHSHF